MRTIFACDATDAVLSVDASNAFNQVNRQGALHNISILYGEIVFVLLNVDPLLHLYFLDWARN